METSRQNVIFTKIHLPDLKDKITSTDQLFAHITSDHMTVILLTTDQNYSQTGYKHLQEIKPLKTTLSKKALLKHLVEMGVAINEETFKSEYSFSKAAPNKKTSTLVL